MSRLVFFVWLLIVAAPWMGTGPASSATSPFETSGNDRWIVFASRQNVDEAIGLARRFGSEFGQPIVMSTTNGWFAISVGPLSVQDPTALKKKLAGSWSTPKDAFLSKGQTFVAKVWQLPKSPVLAKASSSEQGPRTVSAAGLEVKIDDENGRKVVHVRREGLEVVSTTFGNANDMPYLSAEASIVRLDPSSAFPQVVATYFSGGAHCCTQMRILTFLGNRWEIVNVGEFDVNGPDITDLLGDGSAELVGKDDSFDYAFASYAESYAPPKILRLTGSQIKDVSNTPEFQRPILQMLLATQGAASPDMWRDNGFLAGWVAHSAILGSGAEAWRRMLDLYNRNSDWDLSICVVATNGIDPCPESAKRSRDFPTALREHLVKNGYSIAGIAEPSSFIASPSFDCNKARARSEIEICHSPRLAELDNVLAAGYAFVKATRGRPAADVIGIPYWKLIAQCEGDADCIAERQSEEITALALAGAPVSLPKQSPPSDNPAPTQPTPSPSPVVAKAPEEQNAAPKQEHQGSSGTGFLITTAGVVLTNAHVVENCSAIRATASQGTTSAAKVVARDVLNDLALLSTGLAVNKVAAFRSTARLGEAVEAFGYPLTDVLSKSGNFTLGNVSALVGVGEDSRYLQISAPVQPGNSGGPLLDQSGNVVGVVSAKLNALRLMLATNGDIPQNVNFAIKSSIATNFLDSNGVAYATGAATQNMQPADSADLAKAISVFIECE
jgi:S1-C subfamily serine protease